MLAVVIWTGDSGGDDVALTADEIASWWWSAQSIAYGLVLASIPLLLVRPQETIGWAVAGMLGLLVGPGWDLWATVVLAAGAVLALLAVADAAGASRQRRLARGWGAPEPVPECDEATRAAYVRWRAVPVVGFLAFGVAGGFAVASWLQEDRDDRAFHEVAARNDGVVVAVAEDSYSVRVRLDGGVVVRVATPVTYPVVGDDVQVLTAPGTDRRELVSDPYDPTDSLITAAFLLLPALVLALSEIKRRRAARRLMEAGGPLLDLVAVPSGRWVELRPVDARGWTMSRVRLRGELVLDRSALAAATTGGVVDAHVPPAEIVVDDVHDSDAPTGASVYGYPTPADPYPGGDADGTAVPDRATARHLAQSRITVVQVHGLLAQGDFPLVRTADGRWLVARRAARDNRLRVPASWWDA